MPDGLHYHGLHGARLDQYTAIPLQLKRHRVLTANHYSGLGIIGKKLEGGCLGVVLRRASRLIGHQLVLMFMTQMQRKKMPSVNRFVIGSLEMEGLNLRFCLESSTNCC